MYKFHLHADLHIGQCVDHQSFLYQPEERLQKCIDTEEGWTWITCKTN
jgi:hypothetical protein